MNIGLRRVSLFLGCAVLGACGSSAKQSTPSTTASSSTAAPSTSSSTATSSTAAPTTATTTAPPNTTWIAIWPTATSGTQYRDPVVAARSFATEYLHFTAPIVGAFRAGDARSGEVPIRPVAGGPVTTALVRRLGSGAAWSVVGATTPYIELTDPATLSSISSPVRLRGTSTAFEATVQVSIREDDVTKALVESYLMGGANGQMGPFDASFTFATPASKYGAIVLYTISSADGHVREATAIRVQFAGA